MRSVAAPNCTSRRLSTITSAINAISASSTSTSAALSHGPRRPNISIANARAAPAAAPSANQRAISQRLAS